jgi:hypothetical protein
LSKDLWIGLLASVPVGILVNLGTPYISRLGGAGSQRWRRHLSLRELERRKKAQHYVDNPGELLPYVAHLLARCAFNLATLGLVIGLLVLITSAPDEPPGWAVGGAIVLLLFAGQSVSSRATELATLTQTVLSLRRVQAEKAGQGAVNGNP